MKLHVACTPPSSNGDALRLGLQLNFILECFHKDEGGNKCMMYTAQDIGESTQCTLGD